MADKKLKIDSLLLDLENPRIVKAGGQREALQQIITDQDVKLARARREHRNGWA